MILQTCNFIAEKTPSLILSCTDADAIHAQDTCTAFVSFILTETCEAIRGTENQVKEDLPPVTLSHPDVMPFCSML